MICISLPITSRPGWPQLLIVCLVLLLGASCTGNQHDLKETPEHTVGTNPEPSPVKQRKVRLMPYWVTSAQFAGYYIGIEKGIFSRHGIDLEVIPFDPFIPTRNDIENGRADFSLLWLVNFQLYKYCLR